MVIGVTDIDKYTFSQQLIDHWESLGHEVRKSVYHEPKFVEECDVVFYDFASVMVGELAKHGKKPKRCVVRSIDIENYMNYHDRFNYDLIDSFIFLNNAQEKLLEEKNWKCPKDKVHIIPPGINLEKFTLRKNSAFEQKETINMVYVGRFWIGKNVLGAIQSAYAWSKAGKRVELHLRGQGLDPRWWKKRVEHELSMCDFPVHIDERVEDMNEYLEDKDVMIVPSFKEAFSYVTAEAMAKGIPVLTANWYGATEVWPEWMIYRSVVETLPLYNEILQTQTPESLRKIVADRYDEQIMFNKIDRLMGL